jgi:hypothetical protein
MRFAMVVVVLAAGMVGCGGDAVADVDSGMTPGLDSGMTPEGDAGVTPEGDSGVTPGLDSGMTPEDDAGGGGDVDAGECPTGMTGAGCTECATGYQDADGNGVCELGCAATGGVALNCGDRGTCEDSAVTGSRGCVCDEGWSGALCATCATGYELVAGECEPALGVTTGLQLWYDADHSNVVLDTEGRISAWPSRVNSLPLTNGTASGRPTLQADAWNGRSAASFTGGERLSSSGSTGALSGQDFTIFVVAGPVGTAVGAALLSVRSGTSYGAFLETASGGYRFVHRSPPATGAFGGDTVTTTRPTSVPQLIRVVRSGSGAITGLRLSVAEGGNLETAHNALTTPLTQAAIGTNLAFVLGEGPSAAYRGRIGEVLVYNRTLTSAEVTQVQAYILRKWGI